MNSDEDKLKSLWQDTTLDSNGDEALKRVLSTTSRMTSLKDVTSLFIGWIWVVFLGFGASMYSAKRKFDQNNQQKRNTPNLTPQHNNNNTGEL